MVADINKCQLFLSYYGHLVEFYNRAIFSYSIHFIDNDRTLQSRCLHTLFVPKDPTADNLSELLTETIAQWKLGASQQVCITTDNGSNIIIMCYNS